MSSDICRCIKQIFAVSVQYYFFVIKSRKLVGVRLTSADSESNLRDRISNDDVVTDHCYTVNTQT